MGSGLIYAVIIGMWVAYFIPLWLRRHEERAEARSADRFSHAMRILSRRHGGVDRDRERSRSAAPVRARADAQPARPAASGRADAVAATGHGVRSQPGRGRTSARLARRRRRVLAFLLIVLLATSVATPLTLVAWPVPVAVLGATLIYLIHLRVQARRSRQLLRTRTSVRRRSLARLSRFESADRIFQARRALRAERAAEAQRVAAQTGRRAATTRATGSFGDGEWQPVPVPLPTYVTKPAAPRAEPAADHDLSERQPFDQTVADDVRAEAPSVPGADRHHVHPADEPRRAVND